MSSLIRSAARRAASVSVAGQVWLLAGVAALSWLPFLGVTLSRDEAGLLMVGSQWGEGRSLYGDYWVDRPPLLIALLGGISLLGDGSAVRLMGPAAAAASVLAAAALGRAIAPHVPRAPVALAAIAAAATASPLLGAGAVDAESLAVPFVLMGSWAMVRALGHPSSGHVLRFALLAGVFGASAALVKQTFIDVFVFAGAALVVHARQGGEQRRHALVLAGSLLSGGVLACVPVLGVAALLGTGPVELWDALVVFRGEASAVLAASATADTAQRLAILIAALVATALPLVVLAVLPALLQPPTAPSVAPPSSGIDATGPTAQLTTDLRLPAAIVLGWELLGVFSGGSYWLHYLMALLPGIALLVGVALQRHLAVGRALQAAIAVASISTIVTIAVNVIHPEPVPEKASIDYLRAHASPGDTGVVAFGAPNILYSAGLTSPYQHLWSLPVRVRDPQLHDLAAVLAGPNRPNWLVVVGSSIATWGVDEGAAQPLVERYYTHRAAAGDFHIYSLSEETP